MSRKKWVPQTEITPGLLKLREKKKWQIALRRYVLQKNRSPQYAPYFGLDINRMRTWFEMQFESGISWDGFAKKWQFEHIIPVSYFDFTQESELKLCWNFMNLRVVPLIKEKEKRNELNVLAVRDFFEGLYQQTQYPLCLTLLDKLNRIEQPETKGSEKQQAFIIENRAYLDKIDNFTSFEFDLLNSGRSIDEVIKEVNFLKKF